MTKGLIIFWPNKNTEQKKNLTARLIELSYKHHKNDAKLFLEQELEIKEIKEDCLALPVQITRFKKPYVVAVWLKMNKIKK